MSTNQPGSGTWTYRSLINNPDLTADFDTLEFGRANLKIDISPEGILSGKIFDTGWELTLKGSAQYGNPATLWFQGSGIVSGAPWVYDYLCYIVPHIPNGVNQVPALVGSICRVIPHPNGNGGTSPAGVVASFYAVLQSPE
ncbi:hypothetical protein [Mucilaginibacter sp. FT3.2]|uniref:hypothetical protein n=1 Tax=Mucilaginibacter sp. FT3.2 TaxID=2723090 RepID=UPI00161CA76B|nr:hypothetical protein [Mucilaginibacter sp. FT3.2]MBB6233768.1 hypothetical protein [Mucilaginibacter sp. FT3.2]